MPAVILSLPVAQAATQLKALSDNFRALAYDEIVPAVAAILGRLRAADALEATRDFGLRSPRTRKECIAAVARAIAERLESWQRIERIGSASPFTF